MADQSYLDKIILTMHNKCSDADIAGNSVNHSNNEQRYSNKLAHSNKQMAARKHCKNLWEAQLQHLKR